ncbi:hypothetical protein JL721_8548 [Aureococcus anophagefferens]|nr:hypothetical protein JL721_8548 [Aureococcus anophagefferens]
MALFFPSCFCYSDDQADSDSEAVLTAELLEPLDEARAMGGRSPRAPGYAVAESCRVLDLSRNLLEVLEPTIFARLRCLVELDLSRNKIRVVPPEIAACRGLCKLNLLSNSLFPVARSLPVDALATLPLVVLDVRFNKKIKAGAAAALREALPGCDVRATTEKPTKAPQACDIADSCAGARDASTLRAQLEPYSTPQLTRRGDARRWRCPTTPGRPRAGLRGAARGLRGDGRRRRFGRARGRLRGGRACVRRRRDARRARRTAWTSTRERPRVDADHYLTLQRPRTKYYDADGNYNAAGQKAQKNAAKLAKHRAVWDLAVAALAEVDAAYAETFTSLAVTHGFRGSPHIDTENLAAFYGCSLGDYSAGGGMIAVEYDASTVCWVDTRRRFGRVDGRFPHWVTDYSGERYSLIYYRTEGDADPLPDVPVDGAYRLEGAA